MNGKSVLGIIFANIHEEALDTLTAQRTMGSVPFCSRYRLIDFPLSNMVESGITKIGVITNANFRSLMDHVGTGKPWDLSRKNDGLYLLPPFSVNSATMWGNRIDAIFGNIQFLNQSNQDYVLMSDCNQVLNMDYEKLFDAHEQSGADVTIVGVHGEMPTHVGSVLVFDQVAEDGRITGMSLCPEGRGEVFYSCNIVLMQKALFESLVTAAHSKNEISFQRNVLLKNVDHLRRQRLLCGHHSVPAKLLRHLHAGAGEGEPPPSVQSEQAHFYQGAGRYALPVRPGFRHQELFGGRRLHH